MRLNNVPFFINGVNRMSKILYKTIVRVLFSHSLKNMLLVELFSLGYSYSIFILQLNLKTLLEYTVLKRKMPAVLSDSS